MAMNNEFITGTYRITFFNRRGARLRDLEEVVNDGGIVASKKLGYWKAGLDNNEAASFAIDLRVFDSLDIDSEGNL